MSEKKKIRRGRPRADKPMVRMPDMMVKPDQLKAYKAASKREEMTFSAWVRAALDEKAK